MQNIKYTFPNILLLLGFIFLAVSCGRDLSDDATEATFPKNGDIFFDGFSPGLEYLPYGDSYFEAFSVDTDVKYSGTASMRFDVPNVGDPKGAYAGAIFPDNGGRNLTEFDALTFWAKGTEANTVNDIGFGQDFGENQYEVSIQNGLQLTTNWKKYTIPIPDPSKLTQEKGLFWYAEGPEDGKGYSFWIDELQFVKLGTIAQPRPSIYDGTDVTIQTFLGLKTQIPSTRLTVNLEEGIDRTVNVAAGYFEFTSSDLNVATVDELGLITAVSNGTAVVTAKLNGVGAAGSITLEVSGTFENAPMPPSRNPDDVISIFSNAYEDEPVDYYNGFWAPFQTTQGGNNLTVNADDILSYSELNFVGIQFAENVPTIDVSQMTHFHFDVQVREEVEPGDFLTVRLVDAGADNVIGGNDDRSSEITLTNTELNEGEWLSLDVPFTSLGSLSSRSHLGQIIFVTDATIENIYVDNIYFYKESGGGPSEPTTAAPSPLQDPGDVISVYSDAFTNISGTDLNPDWGQATVVSETTIAGNNTLLYQGLNFQGIQLGSSQDVTGMDFLHIDYWTTTSTTLNSFLISNGPVEASENLAVPSMDWASIDIPLGNFSPVDLADIIQLKFDGNGDIYLDNIYFYSEGGESTEPTEAAPSPIQDAGNVISVYSDAYSNIGGTDLNPNWGQATVVSEILIEGNNTLLYSGLNYQGIQLGNSQDATGMDFLHIDYWTANSSSLNSFLISNGPVEAPNAMSVPTNGWASIDIPLGNFSPVDLADIIQLKFDGNGDIYLDNIYFYSAGGGSTEPTQAAPTPVQDPGKVISVYSDAYTNIGGTDLNPNWGQATVVSEILIEGNNTLLYSGLNYQGIQLGSSQNTTGMEFLHIDYWTANSSALNSFLVSNGPVEAANAMGVPTSGWASIDIPLGDFSPVDLADIIQLKFDGNGDIYLDNIYFYGNEIKIEPELPLTFEDGINSVIAFDDGATAAVIDNPDMGGNTSSKVLEFNKVMGSAWYSGIVFDDALRTTPLIDLANGTVFTVKIWSPTPGVIVRFQLEGGAAPAYEVFQTVSDASQWVTLTYDFTSQVNASDTYPRFSIFPDFDTSNQNPIAVGAIYYIDDVNQQ